MLDRGRALYGPVDDNVVLLDLGSGQARSLLAGAGNPRLVAGELFFTRGGDLFVVPFSRRSRRLVGDPVLVATGVRTEAMMGHAQYSATPGLVLYTAGTQGMVDRLEWVTRDGAVTRTPLPDFRFSFDFDLSPDGVCLIQGNRLLMGPKVSRILELEDQAAIRRLERLGESCIPVLQVHSEQGLNIGRP